MFCGKCGEEVQEGKSFCTHCGAPVVKTEDKQEGTPPVPSGAEATTAVTPQPPTPPLEAPRKKRKVWPFLVAAAGVVVVVGVVLVLVLVVFAGTSPAGAVSSFLKASETKNVDAAMKVMDTNYFKGDPDLETLFKKEVFVDIPDNLHFTGLEYSTSVNGNKATVTVTKGKATYTVDGKQQTEEFATADSPRKMELVKKGNSWYISPGTFGKVFAAAYKKSGDKLANDVLAAKASGLQKAFASLAATMSAQATPSAQQMKAAIAQVEPVLKEYKSAYEKTKAEYQKLLDLGGNGLSDYKSYAKAAIGSLDASTAAFDESLGLMKYVADAKAQAESGAAPDANAYRQKIADFTQKTTDLENKIKEYQQQMSDLEKKLQ
jgi:hypothetical protein